MNDRELLELAAKANSGLVYIEDMGWIEEDEHGNRGKWWNPLTDDGDALRLAVKLEMDLSLGLNGCVVLPDPNIRLEELSSDDPYAATRRAIVRAAAEIGRTMK
jgi:hypothetical protein